MLARDPAQRPADGGEAHAALLAVQKSLEPKRLLWTGWVLAIAALLAAGGFALWYRPLPPGRLLTAMADTDNQTGEADLDGASELLRTGLEQSQRVALMARSRIVNLLRDAGHAIPRAIGEADARIAAERGHAQMLLIPSVRRSGNGYEASVKVIDLGRRETRLSASEPCAAKVSVPAALDRLVARVRKGLSEEARQAPRTLVPAAEIASAHPEALAFYTEGKRLASEGRHREALAAHRKAMDADPAFLLPRVSVLEHMALDVFVQNARPHFTEKDLDENEEVLRRNLRRLSGSDAAFVESSLNAIEAGTPAESVAAYDRAIEAWPEDPRAYLLAAERLTWDRADIVAARPYLEKAIALAPLQQEKAARYLLFLERYDEALARARRLAEASPSDMAFAWLAEVHRQRGEIAEALDAARRIADVTGAMNTSRRVFLDADALEEGEALQGGVMRKSLRWLGTRGRIREVLARLGEQRPSSGAHWVDGWGYHSSRSFYLLPSGDREAVVRELQAVVGFGVSTFPCEAWTLALMGDLDRAEHLALVAPAESDRRMVCRGMVRAVVQWKRGNREAALGLLGTYAIGTSDYYRGEILVELEREREAVEAFRRYRLRRELNFWEGFLGWWHYPRSLYFEAVALERLGERAEALRVANRLLHLWERADPDLPLLAEAKALRKRLADAAGKE